MKKICCMLVMLRGNSFDKVFYKKKLWRNFPLPDDLLYWFSWLCAFDYGGAFLMVFHVTRPLKVTEQEGKEK